jgi:hypothetical protein
MRIIYFLLFLHILMINIYYLNYSNQEFNNFIIHLVIYDPPQFLNYLIIIIIVFKS